MISTWYLVDSDFSTVLGILPGGGAKLYLERNESGFGTLRVNTLLCTLASQLDFGQVVLCYFNGAIRGGFIIERINQVTASQEETPALMTEISGRGLLSVLNDAVVWFDGADESTITVPAASKGSILNTGLTAAQTRGCFPFLDWDFNGSTDSASVSWTDTEEMEFTVGKKYLEVMRTFVDMGVHFDISVTFIPITIPGTTSDFTGLLLALSYPVTVGSISASTVLTLHAYNSVQGTDLSSTIILRRGVNVIEARSEKDGSDLFNVAAVKYGVGDTVGYTDVDVSGTSTARRIERMVDATDMSTLASAEVYVDGVLTRESEPKEELSLRVIDPTLGAQVFGDFGMNDIVTYNASGTESTTERISSITLEWGRDTDDAIITLGFGDPIYDLQAKQQRDISDLKEMVPRIGDGATGTGGSVPPTWVIRAPAVGGIPGPRISADCTAVRIDAFTEGGTSIDFNVEIRTTIGSSGTDMMAADLTADSTGASDTSLAETALTAADWLYLDISAVSGDVELLCVVVTIG